MFPLYPDVPMEVEASSSSDTPPPKPRRRGVTAMEYMVMLSFVLLALILAVQHIGSLTGKSLADSAQNTDFSTGK